MIEVTVNSFTIVFGFIAGIVVWNEVAATFGEQYDLNFIGAYGLSTFLVLAYGVGMMLLGNMLS